ncbi:hypothetical protein N7535_007017 [Penicillium sp. DV-2018c]|nr:hypothetical protein N7461_006892 [Penicillium sp. DV-2018c]KAJ5567711.1 hypothetical protein N7535_007017 [Penicillium sp. DV-2018c]
MFPSAKSSPDVHGKQTMQTMQTCFPEKFSKSQLQTRSSSQPSVGVTITINPPMSFTTPNFS